MPFLIRYGERMNMLRSSFGLVVLFLFLIAVGVGLWWWPRPVQLLRDYTWFRAPQNDQYNNPSAQYYKDLEKRYAEDTYGGSTPEETLKLFIAALESGNIDLASKYFVVDRQEEEKEYLQKVDINEILTDAKNLKLSKKDSGEAFFTIVDGNGIVEVQVVLNKISNGKWKISSL